MPINEDLIKLFTAYLWTEVNNHSIYVLGAQGQLVVDILPKIPDMESTTRTKEILGRISANFKSFKEFSVFVARAFDCSGLGTQFFLDHKIIESDCTADTLYTKYCKQIAKSQLKEGDMVFQQGVKKVKKYDEKLKRDVVVEVEYMHHVGYYVGNNTVIEAKGRAYGVVASKFNSSNWSHAGRPIFWDTPEPEKPVLTRKLYLTDPMMTGDDVKEVQSRLNALKYSCGTADGIFGKKTDIAVKNFQADNNLNARGIVGKKTAEALGFKWEG